MIENQTQLDNSRQKLERLEELYNEEKAKSPSRVRDATLRSLKQSINQIVEEISVFEAHERTAT